MKKSSIDLQAHFASELCKTIFIKKIHQVEQGRDYSIIVDASSSMFDGIWEGKVSSSESEETDNHRWNEAKEVVSILAPLACNCDSDGITLYFFSDGFIKYPSIQSPEHVEILFGLEENQFQGSCTSISFFVASFSAGKQYMELPYTVFAIK